MKIKVTATHQTLFNLWNADYAKNSGKILECLRIDDDGWAICERWKFREGDYTILDQE